MYIHTVNECLTDAVGPLSASIDVAQGTEETAAVVIEGSSTDAARPRSDEVFSSVASPTLMRFEVDVGAGGCSWNNVNMVPGPLPSPEPITGHPVDLGPVVTASFSCHHLPISCGLDRDLQVTSDSDTSGVGLGEAAAWNSPGRSTVLVSFGNLPVGAATDGVPPPTTPSSPVQSPPPLLSRSSIF